MTSGQEGEEHIPDEFEIHARFWRANERIAQNFAQIVELLGLDPELAERLHFAAVESGDRDLIMHAAADLLEAFTERLRGDPALAAKLRHAFDSDPEGKETLARGLAALGAWTREAEEG